MNSTLHELSAGKCEKNETREGWLRIYDRRAAACCLHSIMKRADRWIYISKPYSSTSFVNISGKKRNIKGGWRIRFFFFLIYIYINFVSSNAIGRGGGMKSKNRENLSDKKKKMWLDKRKKKKERHIVPDALFKHLEHVSDRNNVALVL